MAPANNTRGVAIISPLTFVKHEKAAVSNKIVPPTGPTIFSAIAAKGASLKAAICDPKTPCVTVCSNRYSTSISKPASKIASGIVRFEFLISPLTLSADSNPAKAKNNTRAVLPKEVSDGTFSQ